MRRLLGSSAARKGLGTKLGLAGTLGLAISTLGISARQVQAASYASGVTISGTTVNFILNEPADTLTYSINGGAAVALDPTTAGTKMFTLPSPTATFSIVAEKNAATGYTIPTGGTVAGGANGLNEASPEAGLNIISDDTNILTRFNSPRGVAVSNFPNAPNFGSAYISNSAAGTNADSGRVLGDGMYALRADGSDAFGYGDAAQNPDVEGFPAWVTTSANSPFKPYVAADGNVYVTDFSDANGSLIQVTPNLLTGTNVLTGFGGPSTLPAGQNHGSTTGTHVEGSIAAGNLVVYTVDEDLTTAHLTGSGSTTDQNSLWRYDIGSGPLSSNVIPTKVAEPLIPLATTDMARGADGKFYLMQSRFGVVNSATLFVVSADGSTVLFDSLEATRTIKGDPAFDRDILQYGMGVAVSEDQNWLALMLNGSDIAVIPLIDGIPDLANRMVINSAEPNINSGRDIAFDAAGNIHYVSSGQGRYRVLAPGGETTTTLSWNGTSFDFTLVTGGGPGGDDADFDGDGDVDGADFLTWQRGVGMPGDQPDGDANGDNVINGADLEVWKSQFGPGAATPAAAAVPEPRAWLLAAAAAALFGLVTSRRPSLALQRVRVRS